MQTTATRVLVIEDSGAMRALLCSILRHGGYDVVGELSSGADFAATVARLKPDLVCLDQQLPDVDGLTLLRAVRSSHPCISVVMITGSDDPIIHGSAVADGVAGFIKKPFTEAKILAELRQVDHARKLLKHSAGVRRQESTGQVVVVADDSSTMRELLSSILERMGLVVMGTACDGIEAVELTEQIRPDVLCLDLEMPHMGGFEALKRIRKSQPDLCVVICTSHADRGTVREAVTHGASGYILKPFQPEQVEATMRRLLNVAAVA